MSGKTFYGNTLSLLVLLMYAYFERETRSKLTFSRWWQGFVALLFALAPVSGSAQVGRGYVSVEAYVGLVRVVHVCKIVEIKQIEYEKPLTARQEFDKLYRLVFEVNETIRGDEVERLELILSLNNVHYLEYLRDHSVEIMLVGGPNRFNRYYAGTVRINEQGARVDGDRYEFRVLDLVEIPKSEYDASIATQINKSYDSCRMFTNALEVIEGRKVILNRARVFAKKHSKMLTAVSLRVPNEFGALCGTPNAYCMIMLPVCLSTKKTLTALQDDPKSHLTPDQISE